MPDDACPCGSGRATAACCARVHAVHATALTAEQLMRARFTAFALGDAAFLRRTWAPETRPDTIGLGGNPAWTRLEIVDVVDGAVDGAVDDDVGVVEFRAHYRHRGASGVVHERSRFRREAGRWYYVDGVTPRS